MEREEILPRLRRARAVINSIAVAGKQNWQALLLATADLEEVETALAAEENREQEAENGDL